MPTPPIPRAADGFFHPASEAEVIALVDYARANKLQLRARGATHSVAFSIYTDPVDGVPPNQTLEQSPPAGPNLDLALDKMIALTWIDEAAGLVEVEAGCHLGYDPSDPFGASTLANSFLHQAFEKGWAVNIVGGITHQTVSGFTAMGSAGGSIEYAYDNIVAFRVVDGLGQASWIEAGDPVFDAMLTSCGLLGVVTAMRFQLVPMYNIAGDEATTTTGADCPIDLFGPGDARRPSLAKFLTDTPYSRLTWWPQKGCERVQIWQASRAPASNADLVPYQEFTTDLIGQVKQLAASTIYVLIGNDELGRIFSLLAVNLRQFHRNLGGMWGKGAGELGAGAVTVVLGALVLLVGAIMGLLKGSMRALFRHVLPLFAPLSKPAPFHDWYWRSLCMDNTADDVLLGTEFIEVWVPIQHTQRVMTLFRGMFEAKGSAATGYYAQEIYAAAPTKAWINPSYSDGADEYKDGVSRFDVYWYREDMGVPNKAHGFFTQYWDLLRAESVPFRFHWGKFIPFYDFPDWAAFYRAALPKFDDFLALRAQRDPDNVFFTSYWQLRFLGRTLAN
ncbi:MAG: hypothetical protein ACREBO_06055 [Novosphingobium sp.]